MVMDGEGFSGVVSTPAQKPPMVWKDSIRQQLTYRNRTQTEAFTSLILFHNRIFEGFDALKVENLSLTVVNEKLRQENVQLQVSGGGPAVTKSNEQVQMLERKLFRIQEEVTELLKAKGDNAQQVINLTAKLQERDEEMRRKDALLDAKMVEINRLQKEAEKLRESFTVLELSNATLQDEYNSLHMAFSRTELNLRKLQEENAELVERWMKSKALDADRLNAENEQAMRQKTDKLRRELAEAAKDAKVEEPEDGVDVLSVDLCLGCPVPKVACKSWDAHESEVNALLWNSRGSMLLSGGGDKRIRMWNISRGGEHAEKGMLTGNNAAVMSLDFSTGEGMVLAASNDFASRIWTPEDQRLRHTLTGHSNKVMAAKFMDNSSGATKVVSGSHDRTLKIWDLRSRACSSTIFAGSVCNDVVACEGLPTSIISGHWDKKIRFWDARNAKTPASELAFQGKVTSLSLSADLKYLLACVRDDTLKLMDLLMNQIVHTYSADNFHVGCDWNRACISPDASLVASGSYDGSVFIWNLLSGKLETVLKGEHQSTVIACSWSPTGDFLATCDKNRKIVLWSAL